MILNIEAEVEIEDDFVVDDQTVVADLLGEVIKVKSGAYENVAVGNISKAVVYQTTPRKDV